MRTITTTWLTIVYIFMNPVSVGGAQTQFQHFAPWNPTILPVSSPDGTLKVQIQMQGTGCNWTFGARAETSPPGFLASEVLFSPPPQGMPIPPGVGIVGSIRDLAGVATGRGYVRADVPCQLSRDHSLCVCSPWCPRDVGKERYNHCRGNSESKSMGIQWFGNFRGSKRAADVACYDHSRWAKSRRDAS